jgi:hypothetical protein
MRTRQRSPVSPITSALNALSISRLVARASIRPRYHAWIRMALSVRYLCWAWAARSAWTRLRMAAWVLAEETPPRFIFRFHSSPKAGNMVVEEKTTYGGTCVIPSSRAKILSYLVRPPSSSSEMALRRVWPFFRKPRRKMPILSCSFCDKSRSEDATILKCSRSQEQFYCGKPT